MAKIKGKEKREDFKQRKHNEQNLQKQKWQKVLGTPEEQVREGASEKQGSRIHAGERPKINGSP